MERITHLEVSFRRTKLADAALQGFIAERQPIVSAYQVFQRLRSLFQPESRRRLFLRRTEPNVETLRRVIANLLTTRGLEVDTDYGRNIYRVLSVGDADADEVTALANPWGYISHLSAMQRWGLSDRRPEALHLTMPTLDLARTLIRDRMLQDNGGQTSSEQPKLVYTQHPSTVRGRRIRVHRTSRPTRWLQVEGSFARLATIGQTFVDTLEQPKLCGGMAHVIDIWDEYAPTFTNEIIEAVEDRATPIAKVRAGYLLDERLGQGADERIRNWLRFAQRGGARVLDPSKPFAPQHSEKWMLSINV